ncbi:MAG: PEP-CTERM sorting domain-containing protein [Sulfitobacter sp.]
MKHLIKTGLLVGAIGLAATMGQSATLTPAGSTFVTGTTAAADPQLVGLVQNDNDLTAPFLRVPDPSSIFFVGFDIQNRVTRSDTDGTMIFGPRIKFAANVTGGNFLIDSLSLHGFGDFSTDVAYRTDGAGDVGPTFADRSADGETLNFDFGFPLVFGPLVGSVNQESRFLSIKTEATHFTNTGRASIFGRHVDYPGEVFRLDYSGLAVPAVAPVPVPASYLLMFGGLGALLGLRRKRLHKRFV